MIYSRILQAVIFVAMVASTAYGQSSKGKKQKRYPAPQENPYPNDPRYPDYPQYPNDRNPQYPRNDYPVYNDPNPDNLPPGQAKKRYGGKSARPYAPGQRKKQGYGRNGGYSGNDASTRRYPDNVYTSRTFPLIIKKTRDMAVERDRYGRLFYRHPEGIIYWKGQDERYYLDERYLSYARYTDKEYKDWTYKGDNKAKVKDVIWGRR
jgi:hypothetical protein